MFGPEFASCWLKLGRAEEHANTFYDELRTWVDTDPYIIRKKVNADGSRHSLFIETVKTDPPLDRWSVVIGDCIHNLRSALDHFVYAAAIHETGQEPPVDKKILQFPITDDPTEFSKQSWRVRSLGAGVRAEIERVQPYNRRHPSLPPLLSLLRDLDDFDKHRLLNIVVSQVGEGEFNFHLPPGSGRPAVGFRKEGLGRGAELAWFTIDPPQLDVQYDHKAFIVITVGHVPGPSGDGRTEAPLVMKHLTAEVRQVIDILGRAV
jgi:hypothetical protein